MAAWSKELLVSAPATKNTLDAYPSAPNSPEHDPLDTPPDACASAICAALLLLLLLC